MTRRKRCDGPHAISIHSRDGNLVMRDADERHCAPQFFFISASKASATASACIRHWIIAHPTVRSNIGKISVGDLTA